MHRIFAGIAGLVVVSTRLAALDLPGEELHLASCRRGFPVVAVRIGSEALRFGIDTGTSRSMISAAAAERLHLVPRAGFVLASAGAEPRRGLCATPPVMRVGMVEIGLDCLGWIREEWRLAGAEDVDGLLGADALAQVDLWIDVRRCRARIAPPGSLLPWFDGNRLAVETIERRPAIAVEIPGLQRGSIARLVIDSGADSVILFAGLARSAQAAPALQGFAGRLDSATASRDVEIVRLRGVFAGGALYEVEWAALLPQVGDRLEDGLFPMSALGPVLLDLASGVVVAKARLRTPRPELQAARLAARTRDR